MSPVDPGSAAGRRPSPPSPRLDYVSPLPPTRSGIADYSRDLLPHLAQRCDVRVLALPGQPVAPELVERWHPSPLAGLGEDGRLPLYHMGNNRHHVAVWRAALERPGIVVLHDLVLHHFHLDRFQGDFDGYLELVTAEHGWMGRGIAMPLRWGGLGHAPHFAFTLNGPLVRRQHGLVVHSRWSAAALAEEHPEVPVRVVPMAIPVPPALDASAGEAFRGRLGIPLEAPLLGSFGFQTPIKRTSVAVAALARPELSAAHLLVVGEESPVVDLAAEARRLGVGDRVHVLGFLPWEDVDAAMAACDLCLNLRYPTAGETSASLLRVLAQGRAAVVSDYGQFGELPPEVALRVPLGAGEEEALSSAVGALLAEPQRLAAMGRAARNYVAREHDPGTAASALVGACAALAEPRAPAPARPVPPSTSMLRRRLPGGLEVRGAEGTWREGERRELAVTLRNDGPARWLAAEAGDGAGIALAVELWSAGRDLLADRTWLPLPADLPPGGSHTFRVRIRRPPGPARLRCEPQLLGCCGLGGLGGPAWETDL